VKVRRSSCMSVAFRRIAVRTFLAVASVIVLSWGILHLKFFAANVRASWTYDYAPEPACSVTRSRDCIDHFEVLDITNKDFVLITSVSNPSPANDRVDNISTTFKYGPPFGQRTISVVAVGKDPKGDRITSNPYAARGTASIRPRATVSTILK
jgi:hypothetical protein